jgi:hypothetical protein
MGINYKYPSIYTYLYIESGIKACINMYTYKYIHKPTNIHIIIYTYIKNIHIYITFLTTFHYHKILKSLNSVLPQKWKT